MIELWTGVVDWDGEAMNEPIPVQDALKLIELALEDCDKTTPGRYVFRETDGSMEGHEGEERRVTVHTDEDEPWSVFEACLGIEGQPEHANAAFACLARATMRPMLEVLKGAFAPLNPTWVVGSTGDAYPPLAALRDHYSAVRPDWRER